MPEAELSRECSSCTACCDGWISITVYGEEIGLDHPCPHTTGSGCRIYEKRPVDPCKTFECGWLIEGSPLPDWMRPDNAKVIVMLNKYSMEGRQVDAAVTIGEKLTPASLEWLKNYTLQNGRALIITGTAINEGDGSPRTTITVFGPDIFKKKIDNLIRSGRFSLTAETLSA